MNKIKENITRYDVSVCFRFDKCAYSVLPEQRSFIKVLSEDAIQWIINQCHLLNIPVNVDDSKRYVFPKFSSFNDLDRFTFAFFSNAEIYPQKALFHPGIEILSL
ncbi:hypothetical protein RF11_13261 [Thelohanellus kitauei]|uniref:Uncharacterized protein n=1 Tax=Thelohanellus kitauei TaxID=669202 RepID=A0A0C2J401_THEKT|nr:hypothetical protein RF11_13261 [Thelohanellus kitauei]